MTGHGLVLMVADGLGHGLLAAEAAQQAVEAFEQANADSPPAAIDDIHQALRGTRGAAVAVAALDTVAEQVTFCGLGNIAGAIVTSASVQHMVSMNGTAGHEKPRIQPFEYRWPGGAILVMHSDGLATQWNLARYPHLLGRHPAVMAGVLYRDHGRGRDDVTVVVVRQR